MKRSVSISEDLSIELEFINSRLKHISNNFNHICSFNLKDRLNKEYKFLQNRIIQIGNIAEILLEKSNENISYGAILLESSKRSLRFSFNNKKLFFS